MIEIKNLSYGYEKGIYILDNISLTIEDNSVLAILGRNGCGKSTLLSCLLGFNNVDSIYIDNECINNISVNLLARKIAYIPQNYHQNIDYTVFEFILFGRNPYVKIGSKLSENDYELAYKSADKCGLKNIINKSINKISGGEMQLVYIARALTQDTKIIIMDEPASALDFGNQTKLFMLIKELNQTGKTIIFTTHNPNHLINFNCNVLLINNDGTVIFGKRNDVLTIENLKNIYGNYISGKDGYFINNISFIE
ncbi:MAG: ABC transporter ATP-binding protein [Clostridiales bacterium]|nr:ABC transporter ATP-binding protein [Clostridiales bacterium]